MVTTIDIHPWVQLMGSLTFFLAMVLMGDGDALVDELGILDDGIFWMEVMGNTSRGCMGDTVSEDFRISTLWEFNIAIENGYL